MAAKSNHADLRRLLLQCFAVIGWTVLVTSCTTPPVQTKTADWQILVRRFFAAKEIQAQQLAKAEASDPKYEHPREMAPEVWPYFTAGISGDWPTVRTLYDSMARRSHQFAASAQDVDERLASMVWQPLNESFRFFAQLSVSDPSHLLDYGNQVIRSIPPGSIYLCNSDPGRFLVTGLCENDRAGKPFFVISPNQLIDGLYRAYLESNHGASIRTLTSEDMQTAFEDYVEAARQRSGRNQSLRGEDFQMIDGRPQVKGPRAVFEIAAALARKFFDSNPSREFFVDFVNDGYPMEWMFPYFEPYGPTLRLNRAPVVSLSEKTISGDRSFWNKRVVTLLGDDFNSIKSFGNLNQFADKVYLQKDLSGFTGDPRFIATEPSWNQHASHLGASAAWGHARAAIASVYLWRFKHADSDEEWGKMRHESIIAFSQAFALCPSSRETLSNFVELLLATGQRLDAIKLAEIAAKLNPAECSELRDKLTAIVP